MGPKTSVNRGLFTELELKQRGLISDIFYTQTEFNRSNIYIQNVCKRRFTVSLPLGRNNSIFSLKKNQV